MPLPQGVPYRVSVEALQPGGNDLHIVAAQGLEPFVVQQDAFAIGRIVWQ